MRRITKVSLIKVACVLAGAAIILGGAFVFVHKDEVRAAAPGHMTLAQVSAEDHILKGVTIGPVDVSGLSVADANAKVEEMIEYMKGQKLTVNIGDAQDTMPIEAVNFTWTNTDVAEEAYELGRKGNVIERFKTIQDIETNGYAFPIARTVDHDVIEGFINQEAEAHDTDPVNASIEMLEDGQFAVADGRDGMKINASGSFLNINTYLTDVWNGENPVCDMKVDVVKYKGDAAELSKVKDVLGRASTDFSSSSESRYQNIVNGASKIDGMVLYPGESLSVLDNLMPFEQENGYSMAPSYINGKSEDTFGGGICQVSTTLYIAVLKAELQVDERHNHSMTISYVEPAMDAAVAEGSKDFQFTNDGDHPVYIDTETEDGELTVTIYGCEERPAGRSISFESEVIKESEPEVDLQSDETLAFGYISQKTIGHGGLEAKLWKVVEENGKTEREEVNYSVYEPQNIIYIVGTSTDSPDAIEAIYSAIEENNLDKAYSVIDTYS